MTSVVFNRSNIDMKEPLYLSDFDYCLPKGLIAQYPLQRRYDSRMLVLDRKSKRIYIRMFKDLISYLKKGDIIILNNSKVIPARLNGHRETGGKVEIFLLERIDRDVFKALTRPSKRLKPGCKIFLKKAVVATVLEDAEQGKVIRFSNPKILEEIGELPLPPYIKRRPIPIDYQRYQTVFAEDKGATASPTAGLHFTNDILDDFKKKGIMVGYVTLHISYGTFAPIKEEDITLHKMHREYFRMPKETVQMVKDAKSKGGRVLCVGTTCVRVLESCVEGEGRLEPKEGYTELYIYPGFRFKIVDALLTNFHMPKSTLLVLVSAFAGREFILEAYKIAIEERFRFLSYGDCMLIL